MKKDNTKKSSRRKTVLKIAACLLKIFVVIPTILFNVSPVAASRLIRMMFDKEPSLPPDHLLFSDDIQIFTDISYGASGDEMLDLYMPQDTDSPRPLIIWVHGGAFVGGDKIDAKYFAQALAFNGYAVAVINYSRAPETRYPAPVLQTGQAYTFLTTGSYPGKSKVDTSRVFFAGDSAGAQIVAQFAILQTNMQYRQSFLAANGADALPAVIPGDILKGMLLYCGPYSTERMTNISSPLLGFFFRQTSWAYIGDRDYADSAVFGEIDIVNNVTGDFPPSFITDGNALSFPEHGKELEARLLGLKIPVDSLFFDDDPAKVRHEYQFELQTEAGQLALKRTLVFLDYYSVQETTPNQQED